MHTAFKHAVFPWESRHVAMLMQKSEQQRPPIEVEEMEGLQELVFPVKGDLRNRGHLLKGKRLREWALRTSLSRNISLISSSMALQNQDATHSTEIQFLCVV